MVTSSWVKVRVEIGYDDPAVDVEALFVAIAQAPRMLSQVAPEPVLPKEAASDLTKSSTTDKRALRRETIDAFLNPERLIMLLCLLSIATR
jgi:hypothetical protein